MLPPDTPQAQTQAQTQAQAQSPAAPRQAPLALVVAAGQGQRFGSQLPKQYHALGKAPVLTLTLTRLFAASACRAAMVVIHPDYRAQAEAAIAALEPGVGACCHLTNGGASRQESVRLGLEALADVFPAACSKAAGEAANLVLIHDAARPLLSPETAQRLLDAAGRVGASVPVLPVADTLKRLDADQHIAATVDRSKLMRVQTPQVFALAGILDAHRRLAERQDLTDDASLYEALGWPVAGVEGDECLLKITSQSDLELVRALAGAPPEGTSRGTRQGKRQGKRQGAAQALSGGD